MLKERHYYLKNEAKCHGLTPLEKIQFGDYVINICCEIGSLGLFCLRPNSGTTEKKLNFWKKGKLIISLLSIPTLNVDEKARNVISIATFFYQYLNFQKSDSNIL